VPILLPDKHTSLDHALLGQTAFLASRIGTGVRVARWWAAFHERYPDSPYQRFVLAADVLHALGAVELHGNVITRSST
jgi:hypothetical protein